MPSSGGAPARPLGVAPEARAGCAAGGSSLLERSSDFLIFLLQALHDQRVTAHNVLLGLYRESKARVATKEVELQRTNGT